MPYIVTMLTLVMQIIVTMKDVNMFYMSEIGQRIKALRTSRKLTQQTVADYVGVSRVAVTKWENGDTSNLKFFNITKLLQLYNISYDELTTGKLTKQADMAASIINSLPSDNERNYALHALKVACAKLAHGSANDSSIPDFVIDGVAIEVKSDAPGSLQDPSAGLSPKE